MINQLIASFVFNILILESLVTGVKFSDTQDVEIDRLLKKLNKPALKSIQSPDGDIIDCVHIKNHPIYDHPLFKNHTIQMRPSAHLEGWENESSDVEKGSLLTQLWTINGKCPQNSIPIIRTKREDILRAKSIKRYGMKDLNNIRHFNLPNSTNHEKHEYAVITVEGRFHGVKGTINVWKPSVQVPQEFSLAQIWLMAGPRDELNTIEFGWQVYPRWYSGAYPRFFSFWTSNGYKTGCYNVDCAGFVLVNQEFALGGAVSNVSILNGTQYDFSTCIIKDPNTGNWWLKLNHHLIIGYWPSMLFNHLGNGATTIEFGGEIVNYNYGGQHTTTKMGSGNFAQNGYQKAAYFKKLQILDQKYSWKPIKEARNYPFQTKATCYNVIPNYSKDWGNYFYYGGPGRRNRYCP